MPPQIVAFRETIFAVCKRMIAGRCTLHFAYR